ncbi:hypothetical protein H4R34_002185 [Dimargaris verticillata]|uniref:Extracellular metalloproteinase n=1 Tax=Dimargaris verticillata TaxID=2761393 RepID=A0A9W8EA77_9FUNG|nr:hypothetical protein H4R34_002185 [Dimargaris verticillata]
MLASEFAALDPPVPQRIFKILDTQPALAELRALPPVIRQYMQRKLAPDTGNFVLRNRYRSPGLGVDHLYYQQVVAGMPVLNADANLNIRDTDDVPQIASFGYSDSAAAWANVTSNFATLLPQALLQQTLARVIGRVAQHLGKALENIDALAIVPASEPSTQETTYTVTGVAFASDNQAKVQPVLLVRNPLQSLQAWSVQVRVEPSWLTAVVDATTYDILGLMDYTRPACYRAFSLVSNDPEHSPRERFCDPWNPLASPLGWQRTVTQKFTETMGNNVRAQARHNASATWQEGSRPQGLGPNLVFDFPLPLNKEPTKYTDAAITNLFYRANLLHDLFYQYGFDEAAGNFQQDNLGRGGKGDDPLIAWGQEADKTNNALFRTPPDGESPTMWMYLWDNGEHPFRDGCLDGGVMTHEYTHGVAARLTGGPSNVYCLLIGDAAGLSEGWCDWVAIILQVQASHNRHQSFAIAPYASHSARGIRSHLYSTNRKVNPLTYGWLNKNEYNKIHRKGEIWATVLYEVFWDLVDRHGFDANWFSPSRARGNTLALQLILDALKLQPCLPEFTDARDAILQAEQLRTHRANRCLLWHAFARRGLGVQAKLNNTVYTEDFSVPVDCH